MHSVDKEKLQMQIEKDFAKLKKKIDIILEDSE